MRDILEELGLLAELEKEISWHHRGWFQSIFFWPGKTERYRVCAKQTTLNAAGYRPLPAVAYVKILDKNGTEVFSENNTFPLPIWGTQALLSQVYLVSQCARDSVQTKWQKILRKFCLSYKEFQPPTVVS